MFTRPTTLVVILFGTRSKAFSVSCETKFQGIICDQHQAITLGPKLGDVLQFAGELDLQDVNMEVVATSLRLCEDRVDHVDCYLKGNCPVLQQEINLRLRLQSKSEKPEALLLYLLQEKSWTKDIENQVHQDSGEYFLDTDEFGDPLLSARKYTRAINSIDDLRYVARHTVRSQKSEKIAICSEKEITQWHFLRKNNVGLNLESIDFLILELEDHNKFSILRGVNISLSNIEIKSKHSS
jgi:hypothetical protein